MCFALYKGVRTRRTETYCKIMIAMFCIQALKERLLARSKKSITALTSDLRYWCKRYTILYCYPFGGFQYGYCRTGEMFKCDLAYPCIGYIFQCDGHPAMVFIFSVILIISRTTTQVLYTAMGNTAGPLICGYCCAAISSIQSSSQRSTKGNGITIYRSDSTVPVDIAFTGFPSQGGDATAKMVHTQELDPCDSRRTVHQHLITGFELLSVVYVQSTCVHSYISIGDPCRR